MVHAGPVDVLAVVRYTCHLTQIPGHGIVHAWREEVCTDLLVRWEQHEALGSCINRQCQTNKLHKYNTLKLFSFLEWQAFEVVLVAYCWLRLTSKKWQAPSPRATLKFTVIVCIILILKRFDKMPQAYKWERSKQIYSINIFIYKVFDLMFLRYFLQSSLFRIFYKLFCYLQS